MKPRLRAFLSGFRSPLSGLAAIFFMGSLAAAFGGPPSVPAVHMTLGGVGSAPAALSQLAVSALDTSALAAFCVGLVSLAVVVGALHKLTGKPEKREVSGTVGTPVRFATHEELAALRAEWYLDRTEFKRRMDHLEHSMVETKVSILEAGDHRAAKIHEKIDYVAQRVAELVGAFNKRPH
jgi:hypothetical protein